MKKAVYEMPELLYFGRGKNPSAQLHQHAFYQIEFCLSGQLFCRSGKKRFVLSPGEFWLIPPELPHQFLDNRNPYEYLSIKFSSCLVVREYYGCDPLTGFWLNSILRLVSSEKEFSPYSGEGKEILENYLLGILRHHSDLSASSGRESSFLMALREEVCKGGYKVNVAELANRLHCTRSQLQYRFVKECGGNANIKHFIEDILIALADRHLKYSSMNLSEIAVEMNFPSIYNFSRFYKRKTGCSPLKNRKKIIL